MSVIETALHDGTKERRNWLALRARNRIPGRSTLRLAALAACLMLAGCHRGPPVVYVEGVVRMDGVPLEGANVGFSPVGTPGAMPAGGLTDAQGKFVLSAHTARFGAGTTVGDYVVIVTKTVIPPGEEEKDSPKVELVTPATYRAKETSPLRATVKRGRNRFEFDLAGDPK